MTSERPKEILAPVDFSGLSALSLQYANLLAGCSQAHITALHAYSFEPPPYFTSSQIGDLERDARESLLRARRHLRQLVNEELGPGAADARVEEGLAADVIERVAAESGASWIVMGTHGRTGINSFMLGSVAEHVLRRSRIPVLTVRGSGTRLEPIRNILCPVNNTPSSRRALALAADLAKCTGARVKVVHVQEPGKHDSIEDLCAWVPEAERPHCDVSELLRGDPALEIVNLSAASGCDLLVVGAQHKRFSDSTVLGTTTIRVVRHAHCPVFTVYDGSRG